MRDDPAIERWLAVEMGGLAKSMVASPRPVGDLVAEERPTAKTRGGDVHEYDKGAIDRLAARLGPLARRRVKVPVTFWVGQDLPTEAYVQDEAGFVAMRAVGAVPEDREPRDGKMWVALSLAREVANRYPTLFQFVFF